MTQQQGRTGKAVWRAALALAAAATGLIWFATLLAPTAAASPESDADDAITAAWEKAGGDTSNLGAAEGDVYPVGEGFAQDFAGGKIFFTPATGARTMYGAVLDKYESLGGPAGSDLGFPTSDEVPGLAGPDSRVSIFSAVDKPVIFWTPEHGAFVVRGAINAAWDKLGSSGGVLGVPVGDESYAGEAATQAFSGGQVSWNRVTKVFTTVPPQLAEQLTGLQIPVDPTADIDMAWRAAGGASGPLGAKQGGQYPIGDRGQAQNFAGGKVFFSPATGANAVESQILEKYESLGGPLGSDLGFPIADEADGGIPDSRISSFSAADQPVIFWTRQHGAFVIRGAMKAAWDRLGGATGKLGAPLGDQTVDRDVVAQTFIGGTISWNPATNTFSSKPADLASALSGVQVPGQNKPASAAPTGGSSQAWHWWWLLVAVPVLLLAGVLALAGLGRRRRLAARIDNPPYEPDHDVEGGYEDDETAGPAWPAGPDGDHDMGLGFDDDFRQPAGQPSPGESPGESDQPPQQTGGARSTALDDRDLTDETAGAAVLSEVGGGDSDPDAVDTAPTRVPAGTQARGGRHAVPEAAGDVDAPEAEERLHPSGRLAIHLPLDDPYQVPEGYPIKANASFGLYYTPDSALYEDTLAEIWFASEEIAQASGFVRAE